MEIHKSGFFCVTLDVLPSALVSFSPPKAGYFIKKRGLKVQDQVAPLIHLLVKY
jgi:hypothetical protein